MAAHTDVAPVAVADAPLETYRSELLELAFRAASAVPVEPHIKKRSRAQEGVVAACWELDQPVRALRYVEGIENWRRGAGYADYAHYCAERGATEAVDDYLERALEISELPELRQQWRRDRIRAKVAQTHFLLGRDDAAREVAGDVVSSEVGRVDSAEARVLSPVEVSAKIEALTEIVRSGNLDEVRSAIDTFEVLYGRFYAEEDDRGELRAAIAEALEKVPLQVRIETVLELGRHALRHGDAQHALELALDAQTYLDSARWLARDRVPLMAHVAKLRHRAGDEQAVGAVAAALELYEKARETIYDVWRAGALRPVAEAYLAMGETEKALAIYARAVEEGSLNPNVRPCAEDLAATCVSMAVHSVDPPAELWARMRSIHARFGKP